jgi:hypothetical protein
MRSVAGANSSAAVCESKVPCWGLDFLFFPLPVHLAIAAHETVEEVDQAVECHGLGCFVAELSIHP